MNIRKIIREEIDDLKWIKDTEPSDFFIRLGDKLIVHNKGNKESFIEWLGMFDDDYLSGNYGENITGEIIYVDKDFPPTEFILKEKNTGDEIHFPINNTIKNISKSEPYTGLDLYYEPI